MKPSKKIDDKIKRSPVLVYTKPLKNDAPVVDKKQDSVDELNDAVADLATEVGGNTKQGSSIYNATARVQEALRVFTETHDQL
jgi:hypothetical protein